MEKILPNLAALEGEAASFVRSLRKGEQATLVTLSGELGAGKTAFTKAVAKELGVSEHVTSPTFVLQKIYRLPEGKLFRRLAHLDAYRLKSGNELTALHFDDLLKDPATLIIIEWPQKVADALPEASIRVAITAYPDGSRAISYA